MEDLVKHLKLDSELPTDDHKIMDFLRAITVTGCLGGAIARRVRHGTIMGLMQWFQSRWRKPLHVFFKIGAI